MQARLHEAQSATSRVATLESESAELVRRILEMKDREADRMNEMNRQEADTVRGGARRRCAAWLPGWLAWHGHSSSLRATAAGRAWCTAAAWGMVCSTVPHVPSTMNHVRPCTQPVATLQLAKARQEAASILSEARAKAMQVASRRPSEAVEFVDASLHSLGLSDGADAEQPASLLKRWAGGRLVLALALALLRCGVAWQVGTMLGLGVRPCCAPAAGMG